MNRFLAVLAALVVGTTALVTDAEAARTGGGRSIGAQRHYTPPAPRQATPAVRPQTPAAAPTTAPSRWPSMLGGLAIGGLLGSMFGAGGGLVGLLLLALVFFGALMLVGRLIRRAPPPPPPVARDPWPTTRR
jgi:predicted lipid-binding transport protein (Tim44 family)